MNLRAEVFEDRIEFDIELLEAVPLSSNSPQSDLQSYPYPALRQTGKRQTVLFRSLILENAHLRVTIVPDLGGRIQSLFDKRTGIELISSSLTFEKVGPRGIRARQGVEFILTPERLESLGPVDFLVNEDDDGSASITLAETTSDLSWHLVVTLPAHSALLGIEGRVLNRSWSSVTYNAGFSTDSAGVHFVGDPGAWAGSFRFKNSREIMPMQLDVWGVQLVPSSGGGEVAQVTDAGVLSLEPRFRFQATRPISGKAFLQLESGQTLEAPLEVSPEVPFEADLPGAVTAVAIREGADNVLVWPTPAQDNAPKHDARVTLEDLAAKVEDDKDVDVDLREAAFDLRTKHAALVLQAAALMRRGDWERAGAALDDALLYGSENHLAWLMKAMIARKLGTESDDLLNGHFLAPLEPLFRMESFLGQNIQSREASPLVAPLADNPSAMIEGACFLYDLGQYDDLARWIDECLRHRDVPMLRYILAEALLARSPMSVDAAAHVKRAGETPINPPYPWRPAERRVLQRLSNRFPSDERLGDLTRMLDAAQ